MRLSPEIYDRARDLIASRLGLAFPESRRADLERGFIRAAQTSPVSESAAYLARLATLPDEDPEWRRLAGHVTVGETYFFRDRACFQALEHQALPSLLVAHRAEGAMRLRVWSAACATGEEPYSIAILLDRLLPHRSDSALTILATDINRDALDAARRGIYREWSFRETPPEIRERYFHRRGPETFELGPRVRRMVTFAPLNLAAEAYPAMATNTTAMDLILCRNVLMYFTPEVQRAVVVRLQQALVPGGWLVVSPAEASADLLRPLVPVNFPDTILFRKLSAGGQGLSAGSVGGPGAGGQGSAWEIGTGMQGAGTESVGSAAWESGTREDPGESHAMINPQPPAPGPQPLLERARALADEGKLEGAHRLCEAAVAQDPADPTGHFLLAAICQTRGEIPAALEALRRAIYQAPDSVPAHFLMGSLLMRRGERRRGRRYLENVVDMLHLVPPDAPVPGGDGLSAGGLLDAARAYLAFGNESTGSSGRPASAVRHPPGTGHSGRQNAGGGWQRGEG